MSIGTLARRTLGPLFPRMATLYRSLFVDLQKVAIAINQHIPPNAKILDLGGGDGAVLAALLTQREDLQATMIDLAENVGQLIPAALMDRVALRPKTSMRQYTTSLPPPHDCVLISDVVHHVPVSQREFFFSDLAELVRRTGVKKIIIKDIEPGYARSWLSQLADRYISGDRAVSLVPRHEISAHVARVLGATLAVTDTDLFRTDPPNYALAFSLEQR